MLAVFHCPVIIVGVVFGVWSLLCAVVLMLALGKGPDSLPSTKQAPKRHKKQFN